MPRAAHAGANEPDGGDAQTHMCRAAITDGNAFFPAATAICQSRQEHTRQSLQQTSARLTARWRWSPAALAVTSRAVTLHVRFRCPERRESFRAPPPAPGGGHAPLHAAARACLHAHVRCRHARSWGRGRAAWQVRAETLELCTRPQTRFSRGRAGTCRSRGPLVDATEHHGVVHWSQDRGSQRDEKREVVTGIFARSVRSRAFTSLQKDAEHVYIRTH